MRTFLIFYFFQLTKTLLHTYPNTNKIIFTIKTIYTRNTHPVLQVRFLTICGTSLSSHKKNLLENFTAQQRHLIHIFYISDASYLNTLAFTSFINNYRLIYHSLETIHYFCPSLLIVISALLFLSFTTFYLCTALDICLNEISLSV